MFTRNKKNLCASYSGLLTNYDHEKSDEIGLYKRVRESFYHCFSGVAPERVKRFLKGISSFNIKTKINKKEKNENEREKNGFIKRVKNIHKWYSKRIEKNEEYFTEDLEKYTQKKAKKIEEAVIRAGMNLALVMINSIILKLLHSRFKNNMVDINYHILDLGCGDCRLTQALSEKFKMDAIGIDVEGGESWCSLDHNLNEIKIKRIVYDGSNLKDRVMELKEKNPEIKIKLIFMHHSLHHAGDSENQEKIFRESLELLDDDGLLIIIEHNNNAVQDGIFDLQHLLFWIMSKVKKKEDFKEEDIRKYLKNEDSRAQYFSHNDLIRIAHKNDAFVYCDPKSSEGENNPSQSKLFVVCKKSKDQSMPTLYSVDDFQIKYGGFDPFIKGFSIRRSALTSPSVDDFQIDYKNYSCIKDTSIEGLASASFFIKNESIDQITGTKRALGGSDAIHPAKRFSLE